MGRAVGLFQQSRSVRKNRIETTLPTAREARFSKVAE